MGSRLGLRLRSGRRYEVGLRGLGSAFLCLSFCRKSRSNRASLVCPRSFTLVHAAQPGHGVRHGGGGGSHGEGTATANEPAQRDFAAGHRRDQRRAAERYESTHHLPSPDAPCDPGSRPEWATDTAVSGHSRRRQTPASLWLRSRLPGAALLLPAARWQGCGCLARTRCFRSPCPRTAVRAASTRQVI